MEAQFLNNVANNKTYYLDHAVKNYFNPTIKNGYWIELAKIIVPVLTSTSYCTNCEQQIWTNDAIFICTCNLHCLCNKCYDLSDNTNKSCQDDDDFKKHFFNIRTIKGYLYCDGCGQCKLDTILYECTECLKNNIYYDLCKYCVNSNHSHPYSQFIERKWELTIEEVKQDIDDLKKYDPEYDNYIHTQISDDDIDKLIKITTNFIGDNKKYRICVEKNFDNPWEGLSVRLYYNEPYKTEIVAKWIANIIERNKFKLNNPNKTTCLEEIYTTNDYKKEKDIDKIIKDAITYAIEHKLISNDIMQQYNVKMHGIQYGMCVYLEKKLN